MPKNARIHALKGGAVFLETPFDGFFLEQIKRLIPKERRRYLEPPGVPGKGWRVEAEWADVGEHLTRSAFTGIEEIDIDGEVILIDSSGKRLRQESLL